jgi:hypothetical protein
LRETPGNLSGSGSELISISRQPMLLADSILLDPDATIGSDQHKWLFLLVTWRGE